MRTQSYPSDIIAAQWAFGVTSTNGVTTALDFIRDLLCAKVRTAEKPYAPRANTNLDSQSVDTTCGGEKRARTTAKNVDDRKRPIVLDSMGLLLALPVTAADEDDAKAAITLFARLEDQPRVGASCRFAGRWSARSPG